MISAVAYEPHANLIQPDDANAYIWRFIDLPKFLDMLATGALYFTRGDQFDDPYDGMPPDEYIEVVRGGALTLAASTDRFGCSITIALISS
jgi:hypothetical protein